MAANVAALALAKKHGVLSILNTAPAAPLKKEDVVNVDVLPFHETHLLTFWDSLVGILICKGFLFVDSLRE